MVLVLPLYFRHKWNLVSWKLSLDSLKGQYLYLHLYPNCLIRSSKVIAKTRERSLRNGTRVSIKARISSWASATITADGLHPWVLLYTQGRHTLYPSPESLSFKVDTGRENYFLGKMKLKS